MDKTELVKSVHRWFESQNVTEAQACEAMAELIGSHIGIASYTAAEMIVEITNVQKTISQAAVAAWQKKPIIDDTVKEKFN